MDNENKPEELFSESAETPVSNVVETPIAPKKKRKLMPIVIIAVIVVLLGLAAGGYFYFSSTPKRVFDKAINDGINYYTEALEKSTKYDTAKGEGKFSYELSTTDETMKAMFEAFNGITLDYKYQVDYTNKLIDFDLNSDYNNKKLIDLKMYMENSKGYVLLKDVYEKYISTDIEGYDEIFNIQKNKNDVKVIMNSAKKALIKSITKDDFTKEKATIQIDGKDVKATKNSLVIDKSNSKRISLDLLNALKDDSEFIKAANNIAGDDETDVKTELENAIKELNSEGATDDIKMVVSLYTKGLQNKVVKVGMEVVTAEENIAFDITKIDKDNYNYQVKQSGITMVTGTIKSTLKENSKTAENDIEITANVSNMLNLKINIKAKEEYGTTFEKVDVSNSIEDAKLTEKETDEIMEKIMANEGFTNLITNFESIFAA